MAPELLDEGASHSYKTDIYALTMTALEVYTGDVPFAGVSDPQVIVRVLGNQRPARPAAVTSDGLWSLWQEGWNQDPTRRPDAGVFVQRLELL